MLPRSLADFTGPYRESGTQLVYQICPICHSTKWKLYVDQATGRWFCFAAGHGSGGQVTPGVLTDHVRRMVLAQLSDPPQHRWADVELPAWVPLSTAASLYLAARGVSEDDAAALHMVEQRDERRVVVPYFGPQKRIISWIARAYTPAEDPKYKQMPGNKPMYMLPRWESVHSAVLVEGVFDAIRVWTTTGTPVIAIGGTHMSEIIEQDIRTLVRKRLYLLLDHDDAGIRGTFKLLNRLRDRYNIVDVGRLLPEGADPGSTSQVLLQDIMATASVGEEWV